VPHSLGCVIRQSLACMPRDLFVKAQCRERKREADHGTWIGVTNVLVRYRGAGRPGLGNAQTPGAWSDTSSLRPVYFSGARRSDKAGNNWTKRRSVGRIRQRSIVGAYALTTAAWSMARRVGNQRTPQNLVIDSTSSRPYRRLASRFEKLHSTSASMLSIA
jgi:hypothetical protein